MQPLLASRWRLVATITFALFVATASCGSESDDDSLADSSTTSRPPTSQPTVTTVAETTTTTQATFVEPGWWADERRNRQSSWSHLTGDIERGLDRPAPFVLEAGQHTTSQLGTGITFSTDGERLTLIQENPGLIELGKTTPGSGAILIMRPSSIYDGDAQYDANGIIQRLTVTSPVPEDLGLWLTSTEGLIVTNQQQLTIDGIEASSYDVLADDTSDLPFPCQLGPDCVLSFRAGGGGLEAILFDALNLTRVFEIEQPGTDLVVFANATVDEFPALEPILDDLLGSLEVGEPGPSPFENNTIWEWNTYLTPGTYRFGGIGTDIEVQLDATRQILNESGALCLGPTETEEPGDVCLIRITADADGTPLAATDEAVAVIEARASEVELLGVEPMLATEATAIRAQLTGGQPVFHHATPPGGESWPEAIWEADEHTVIWIAEAPDGLWAVTAQTSTEANLPNVVDLARRVFSTLSVT